ncbi:MAG: choice-of-anchor J domain-containing protein, partial [Candidatus Cloacimonadaceae bacterium]|nr:choice-of-anchor J domain-containing protein [Candidatus Cloacimonadaceae bacterium]
TSEWTQVSFPVSAGTRTFTWRYTKDGSVSSGSDCAWIDHIILPPVSVYYAPATGLSGTPADGSITLNWTSPGGSVQSFDIYRNDSYLANTANTTYQDNTVTNGVSYSYYVVAVYAGGDSEPTETIEVTAGQVLEVILGTGTGVTGTQADAPINVYYKSRHGQAVYTKAELNAAGIFGPINLTSLGFDVVGVPNQFLPNFIIRLKHTTATNVSSTQSADGMVTVYGPVNYSPTTGWDMLTLSTPFLWNGIDNLLVDTAFSLIGNYNASGTQRFTTVSSGYRYWRSDTTNQTNVFSGGTTSTNRPNMKMVFAPLADDPEISVSTTSLDFGSVRIYETATQNFSISNTGSGTLEGSISTGGAFSVAEVGTKASSRSLKQNAAKSTINYSLDGGTSQYYTVTYDPTNTGPSSGSITITHNAEGESKSITLSGTAYNPVPGTPTPADAATNVAISQVLSWVNDGTVSAVDVYVGDSELNLVKVADNQSAPLNSYTPATPWAYSSTYYWKVVAHNGSIYSGESVVFSFSTVDDPTVTVFPWMESFENASFPPNGWTTADLDGGGSFWESSTAYNHTSPGTKSAKHGYSTAVPEGQDGWLITPPIVLPANAKMELSFWNYNQFAGDMVYNGVMINSSPDPEDANWEEIWSPATVTTAWSQESLTLNAYAGQTVYLAFVYRGYNADAWYLDDVEIYQVFDYPDGDPITIGEGEEAVTITIDGGNANNVPDGTIPEIPNASFEALGSFVLQLLGEGPWNVTILTSAPWGAYYQGGSWTAVEAEEGRVRFDVEPSKNLNLPILLGDQDVTLPVTLSSFTAVLTAKFDVKIAWVAESETNHAGYNILRSETDELDSAIRINREILQEGIVNGSQIKYEYLDGEVYWNSSYHYWLESVSLDGDLEYFGPVMVTINAEGDNEGIPEIPLQTALFSAFPNPFNPSTNLRYAMSEPGDVRIDVFNARGQLLKSFRNTHNVPGYYQVNWDGRDANGRAVSTGVYFYRMQSGKYVSTKKMVLSK